MFLLDTQSMQPLLEIFYLYDLMFAMFKFTPSGGK